MCAKLKIPLYVLPPRKPEYNGGVERSNRIFREELYARDDFIADSIGAIRFHLKQAVQKYNEYRPHKSLGYLIPLEYIKQSLRLYYKSKMY
ncbi:MAG: transposase [Rickettsiales bacterium]|nr:transposase [Rickettsiales bacterium]